MKKGEANETDCGYYRGYGCPFGMCDNTQNPNLPRRFGDCGNFALPATATTATATTATDGDLPERNDGPGRNDLSGPTATATAATSGA